MMDTTPKDVIKILEATINFMEISLRGENLSPSTDMERQENVDRLTSLIEKLNKIKDKGFETVRPSVSKKEVKKEKKEKKNERPPRSESIASSTDSKDLTESPKSIKSKAVPDLLKAETSSQDTASINSSETTQGAEYILPGACVSSGTGEKSSEQHFDIEELQKKVKTLSNTPIKELKEKATYCGILRKHKKKLLSQWHSRYCVLVDELLFYFRSEDDNQEQGVIILPMYTYLVPPKSKYQFTLQSKDKAKEGYEFQAEKQDHFDKWNYYLQRITTMSLTESEINEVKKISNEQADSNKDTDSIQDENYDDVAGSFTNRAIDSTSTPPDSAEDFYNDVAELPPGIPQSVRPTPPSLPVDPIPTEELYDDVAATNDDFYDDIAVSNEVTPSTPSLPPQPPPQRQTPLIEEETYELIPGQSQPTSPPVPLPVRSPETTDGPVLLPPHIIPPRPATPNLNLPIKDIPLRISPGASPLVSPSDETFTIENIYIGLYDCESDDQNDLIFKRGDILYKLDEIDMNWWLVYFNGSVGLAPSNFMTVAFN